MSMERLPTYGGQALIEGVMMRGGAAVAAAMRAPNGNIVIQTENLKGIYTSNIRKIPFLRGLIILWDALGLGMRFLTISANQQTGEDEKLEGPALYLTLGLSLTLGIALFFVAPAALGHFLDSIFHWHNWWGNFFEGILRLGIMIGYIWGVGKMPEIQRVFAYHGAEHKTINAYEAGAELTTENVSKYSLLHPRCGTSFLLTVVLLSIIFFSLLGPLPIGVRLLTRVLMIPILAGVAYEYIRWTANNLSSPLVKLMIQPNLKMQSLTTREPTPDIVEVAITAFNEMIKLEKGQEQPPVR